MIKLGILLISVAVINSVCADLCTICKCEKIIVENQVKLTLIRINCDGYRNKNMDTLIVLNDLKWPVRPDNQTKYFVEFMNFDINFLSQITDNDDVIGLILNNNSIRNVIANPFQYLPNIEEITIKNNQLFGVQDWFINNNKLKYLGLSNTSISELQPHCVNHLDQLFELDLSHNNILKLTSDFFVGTKNVNYLRVHHNKIYFIETNNIYNRTFQLKFLDLSYNKLTFIGPNQFRPFILLETLILKGNQITTVDDDSFRNLNRIKLIDFSFNDLKIINNFKNVDTIEILYLNNNKIKEWKMSKIPKNLTELYVQSNQLLTFDGDDFSNLNIFNLSHNSIEVLPNIIYENLEIFDLSYNSLSAIPQGMAKRTPSLDTLVLDNNPIKIIRFEDPITLRRLSLNHMPMLKNIEYDSFKNIKETGPHSSGNITCMELEMSYCPYLTHIEADALQHINLCKLDLSYNKLQTLPENLTNWAYIEKGINLQGNPFVCECSIQWMLDTIVGQLYQNKDTQYLLRELRCNEPKQFANKRFIKFYHHSNIFCNAGSAIKMAQLRTFDDDDRVDTAGFTVKLNLSQGPSYITIIISCIVLLLVMIGFGIYWQHQQKKALGNNRRYA